MKAGNDGTVMLPSFSFRFDIAIGADFVRDFTMRYFKMPNAVADQNQNMAVERSPLVIHDKIKLLVHL